MNLRETYNRIAEEWHKDHQQEDWWVEGTDKFVSFLKPGDAVPDVGRGGATKYAYLVKKGLRVVGIDFSEKMIEIAKREVPEGTFLVLDLGDVDKLDYLFDGIFMQAALLHVPKKEVIGKLEKLTKKLKVGGYLYVGVKERKPEGVEEEIKTEDDYGYPYERFFSYFTTDEVESYLRKAGLEVVSSEIKPSGNTNWIQVIGRK